MSSGGGTTTTQSTELPSWLQDAAQSNLARADYVSQLGYVPQYGLDVAGFTPMQTSAMQNTADAASAFGLSAPTNAMAGMPAQQTNNLGFSGYSSGDLYDQSLAQLAQNRPAQYAAMNSMFIDPLTGDMPVGFGSGGLSFDRDAYDRMAQGNAYNPMQNMPVNEGTGQIPQASPEDLYYRDLALMDFVNNNPFAKASLVAQGLGKISDYNATQFENNQLGWNAEPSVNYPVSGGSGGGAASPIGNQYSVADVTSGGGFDPSGTSGGNYSGFSTGGGMVY